MIPMFLYHYTDGMPYEATHPLSYVSMGMLNVAASDGPDGTYALRGRGFDGGLVDLGIIEGSFAEAVETLVIHGTTSDGPYNDFEIELRVLG
jgi:hypothetical protein